MRIFRVEDSEGRGCYRSTDTIPILKHHVFSPIHPNPEDDRRIKRKMMSGEICGFLDIEQALNWFTTKDLKQLNKIGFKLKEIEVKKVTAVGETQVLAVR